MSAPPEIAEECVAAVHCQLTGLPDPRLPPPAPTASPPPREAACKVAQVAEWVLHALYCIMTGPPASSERSVLVPYGVLPYDQLRRRPHALGVRAWRAPSHAEPAASLVRLARLVLPMRREHDI